MRPKLCKHCKERFLPTKPLQVVCGMGCGIARAQHKREAEEKKADIAKTKQRKEALETIPELIKAAQREFNAFIRERDRQAGHPCISSGRPLDWSGNAVDAGHYRSTGAASHLRFDEDNCHAQSKHDNQYLAGNAVDYRLNLIGRIGLERVEALESNNEVIKWSREVLRQIKVIYRGKTRDLKRNA